MSDRVHVTFICSAFHGAGVAQRLGVGGQDELEDVRIVGVAVERHGDPGARHGLTVEDQFVAGVDCVGG